MVEKRVAFLPFSSVSLILVLSNMAVDVMVSGWKRIGCHDVQWMMCISFLKSTVRAWGIAGYIKRPAKPLRLCLYWVRAEISMYLLRTAFACGWRASQQVRDRPCALITRLVVPSIIRGSREIGDARSFLLLVVAQHYR